MIDIIIVNVIVYIIFPCIVLISASIRRIDVDKEVLTKDDSTALRGIAAIFVMFSHYLTFVDGTFQSGLGPAKLFSWFGGLGVCLFFFLSGYGLWLSAEKGETTITFLIKRFATVLPTYFLLRLIFGFILGEYKEGILSFVLYVIGIRSPLWFISEILIIYVLMYIAIKINKKHQIVLMAGFLFIMSLVFLLLGFDARWYNANLVFVIGMLFAKYRSKLVEFLKRKFWLKGFAVVLLFGICSGIYVLLDDYTVSALFKLIAGGLFCIAFVMLLMKIEIKSKPIIYLGKKSLHIYIIHLNIWAISDLIIGNNGILQFLISIVMSIAITVIYGMVEDWINSKMRFENK